MTDMFRPQQMQNRGATPVGHLADLPALEGAAVQALRRWCEGQTARAAILAEFDAHFGAVQAAALADALTRVMCLTLGHARRPLMRHAVGCPCIGGDESAFAQMIAAAAAGDAQDALLFGLVLMSGPAASDVLPDAEALGLGLARMTGHMIEFPGQGARRPPRPLH